MQENQKLYVLTDATLTSGQQLAQVSHAVAAFCLHETKAAQAWDRHKTIVILEVPTHHHLEETHNLLGGTRLPHAHFREPDLGDRLTAVAVFPQFRDQATHLFGHLPLAGKKPTRA